MTNIRSFLAIAAVALVCSQAVQAQFSLPSIGGVSKSPSGGTGIGTDLPSQQDALVRGYVAANKDVLTANYKMEEALNLKDAAAKSRATSDALTEGATKGNLEAADKAIAASTEAVTAELAKQPVLDANSKALYGQGLLALASGASKYAGLSKNVSSMSSGLSSASPLALPKLQPAVHVVSNFPTSMSRVSQTLKIAVAFARSRDIPVPANVTDVLATL